MRKQSSGVTLFRVLVIFSFLVKFITLLKMTSEKVSYFIYSTNMRYLDDRSFYNVFKS